jgi:transcriptional regulator with XRE-family HTH domain
MRRIHQHERRTKLFYVRRAHFMNLRDVAALTGIPPAQLSRYERGLSEPLVTTALKLARLFGTSVEYLFGY